MGNATRGGRRRRALDVGAAAVASLLAFGAVPTALLVAVGNPLWGGLGHTWPAVPRATLCVLTVAAWAAWAACCFQLTRSVIAAVRTGEVRARRGASVVDRFAARIAVGVLALTSLGGGALSATSAAGASVAPVGLTRVISAQATMPRQATRMHQVRDGDTLWDIAEARLDDGADWTTLAALNLGRATGPGERFVDPDHLRSGWTLRLPHDGDRFTDESSSGNPAGHLPELIALGLGSLACAALARRAAQQRRLRPFAEDARAGAVLSDAAVDAAVRLRRFNGVPALEAFESANVLLGWSLGERSAKPGVRAVSLDAEGVSFWLSDPRSHAPEGFTTIADGQAWRVGHAALDDHPHARAWTGPPALPLAFPVGDDGDATWLVTLGPGQVLPVLGESALALCRGALATMTSWAWADTVVVAHNAHDPALRAASVGDPALARHVIFFGDPRAIPREVAQRIAIVTDSPVAATNLTLLVDRHGATLHPIGRVLRPHLLSEETAGAISELMPDTERLLEGPINDQVAGQEIVDPAPVRAWSKPESSPDTTLVLTRGLVTRELPEIPAGGGDATATLMPGPVDVRLLTTSPRLDGLREHLAPNRARRAVELVAYLALHRPDVVTSDRLRNRVLGSSEADATSKTLFNTAHAARRAMGVDDRGMPLFPAATRSGHYRLSSDVSVDVHRASALCAEGRAQSEPDPAIAYYRAALSLVEGEPLANVLSGYSWWEAEGHGARVATELVDAACAMAALATDAGHVDLARWGIEQARMVEPYSEALSRAAMKAAAAAGDVDRLRFEWRSCQRMVDSLDPGSSPSLRTETLYGELSRCALVPVDPGEILARSSEGV